MVEAGIFGCLPCIDLVSVEIACEGLIINKIHTRGSFVSDSGAASVRLVMPQS